MVMEVAIIAGPVSPVKERRFSGSDPPSPLISTEVWLDSGSSPLGFPILQVSRRGARGTRPLSGLLPACLRFEVPMNRAKWRRCPELGKQSQPLGSPRPDPRGPH
jgi:hypothetical protein